MFKGELCWGKKKSQFTNHQKPDQKKVSLLTYVVLMVRKADNAGEYSDQNKISSKTEGSHLGKEKEHLFLWCRRKRQEGKSVRKVKLEVYLDGWHRCTNAILLFIIQSQVFMVISQNWQRLRKGWNGLMKESEGWAKDKMFPKAQANLAYNFIAI